MNGHEESFRYAEWLLRESTTVDPPDGGPHRVRRAGTGTREGRPRTSTWMGSREVRTPEAYLPHYERLKVGETLPDGGSTEVSGVPPVTPVVSRGSDETHPCGVYVGTRFWATDGTLPRPAPPVCLSSNKINVSVSFYVLRLKDHFLWDGNRPDSERSLP